MQLVEALALTPALSPRRGGTIRQRFEKTPFSDRRETGERCSLSLGLIITHISWHMIHLFSVCKLLRVL